MHPPSLTFDPRASASPLSTTAASPPPPHLQVHAVMTRNIADVLGQGERLDSEWE